MFDRLATAMRDRRRRPAAVFLVLVALALAMTHSVVTSEHSMEGGHHGDGTMLVITFCLAVLDAGIALAAVQLFKRRRERMADWRLPDTRGATPLPVLAGPDPPRRHSTSRLQVFLR